MGIVNRLLATLSEKKGRYHPAA